MNGYPNMKDPDQDSLISVLKNENDQLRKIIEEKDYLLTRYETEIRDHETNLQMSRRDTENVLVEINHYKEESIKLQHILTEKNELLN